MLYHGKNKLIFNEMMIKVRFELDQHAELNFYSAISLKQVCGQTCRPTRRFRATQSLLFLLNTACLANTNL